ncbi:LysR family transcriptional regulator [Kiloniella antarctica]|uniref:LysR family transcriptional regulator n=1 Tax=Kiloniella antarctica TaxID=1550907 RepID=A0ABW5BK19_9PROT
MRKRRSLTALRAFEAVARNRSFTLAAEELIVTRPAVSKQIKLLENELSCTLIDRSSNNIQLTPIGIELYVGLQQAFDLISATMERVSNQARVSQGIKILVERDFASSWLATQIGQFLLQYPGISVEITAEKNGHFRMQEDFDFRIFYGPQGTYQNDSLQEKKLCHWIDLPLCSPEYARTHITSQGFSENTHFLLDKNYNPWDDWFKYTEYENPGITDFGTVFNETTLCLSAAIAGGGITIGDSFLALSAIQAADLVMPYRYGLKSVETYSIYHQKDVKHSTEEDIFENWLFSTISIYQNKVDQYLLKNGITIIDRS